MNRVLLPIATLALALTPASGDAAPPAGGTISIEAKPVDGYDPAMPLFVAAASKALTAKGFTVFDDPGHAASVVELVLSRSDVGTGLGRVPGERAVSVVGTGIGVPLSTGNSQVVAIRRIRLELRIHRRDDPAILWHGAAVTVRQAGKGSDATAATDLTQALLAAYPAVPEDVVGVP